MGFFKPSTPSVSPKFVARLEAITWVLIYGGLLTLVLGGWVARVDEEPGWLLMTGGGLAAAIGAFLIYLRSKIRADT